MNEYHYCNQTDDRVWRVFMRRKDQIPSVVDCGDATLFTCGNGLDLRLRFDAECI